MKEYVAFIGGKMCFGTACAQGGDAKRWIGCLRLRRSRCFFKLYFTFKFHGWSTRMLYQQQHEQERQTKALWTALMNERHKSTCRT